MKRAHNLLLLASLISFISPAYGAQITDVQSSFDRNDPFDISLRINYEFNSEKSEILREGLNDETNDITLYNKLKWERSIHVMHFNLAMGLFRDLELVVDLPLVMMDQGKLGFHPALSTTAGQPYLNQISDIDNSASEYTTSSAGSPPLFDVPFTGQKRSGLGDIGLGLRWAPWHYRRDHMYPSWVLGLVFRLPTASIKEAGNTAVGEGLFQVEMNTAISRRVTPFFEPYFDLHGVLKVPTGKSLFDRQNDTTQTLVKPGNSMGLKLGAEFIPWEEEKEERHLSIDLGFGLDYVFEGREYTELFEALGSSPCNYPNAAGTCTTTAYSYYEQGVVGKDGQTVWDSLNKSTVPRSDGITDVEHYGIYRFWAGIHYQPVKYFATGFQFNLAYTQPHLITFADAGKDAVNDANEGVDGYNTPLDGTDPVNEYNPKYVEEWDRVGRRFKTTNKLQWGIVFNLTGQF